MKRVLFFLLTISGLLMTITGIGRAKEAHTPVAIIFVLICIVHIILNRKAVMKYIRGR